jgi:hypothetical protein
VLLKPEIRKLDACRQPGIFPADIPCRDFLIEKITADYDRTTSKRRGTFYVPGSGKPGDEIHPPLSGQCR